VPEIKPVAIFTVRPAGNGAAPHVVIVWSAVIWYENGTPMVPLALVGLVIFGFAAANASFGVATRVTTASAIPSAKLCVREISCEFKRSGIMVSAWEWQVSTAR